MTPHDPQAKPVPASENPKRSLKLAWVKEYLRGTYLSSKELERVERWLLEDPSLRKEATAR